MLLHFVLLCAVGRAALIRRHYPPVQAEVSALEEVGSSQGKGEAVHEVWISIDMQGCFAEHGSLGINANQVAIKWVNWKLQKQKDLGAKIIATWDWHPIEHLSFVASENRTMDENGGIYVPASGDLTGESYDKPQGEFTERQQLWPIHCVQHKDPTLTVSHNLKGIEGEEDKEITFTAVMEPDKIKLLVDNIAVIIPDEANKDKDGTGLNISPNFADGIDSTVYDFIAFKGMNVGVDSYSAFFDNGTPKDFSHSTGLGEYMRAEVGKKHNTAVHIVGFATDFCVKFSAIDALKYYDNVHVHLLGARGVGLTIPGVPRVVDAISEMVLAGIKVHDFQDNVICEEENLESCKVEEQILESCKDNVICANESVDTMTQR